MTILAIVATALAITARAQARPLSRHRYLLDTLAIVPQWRFYAQASIGGSSDLARDIHLLIRDRDATGRIGGWLPLLWHDERRVAQAVWNPRKRSGDTLLSIAEDLAEAWRRDPSDHVQQSVRYLIVLRHCLDAPFDGVEARQFAVVHSFGRGRRDLAFGFVSGWHRP